MGVAIALRKDIKDSFFKEMLLEILYGTEADELLLCSGYFQFDLKSQFYRKPYSFLNDKNSKAQTLGDGILNKCKKVTLVGCKDNTYISGKNQNRWFNQFKDSYDWLVNHNLKNVDLQAFSQIDKDWHAKIALFMKFNPGKSPIPIAAIVGSSNLTRRAMGDSNTPAKYKTNYYAPYNLEADTLIYVPGVSSTVNDLFSSGINLEIGEVLNFSNLSNVYRSKTVKSEADVILNEYIDIMQILTNSANPKTGKKQFQKL